MIALADAQRAEIILRCADGLNNCKIARVVGATRETVRKWHGRLAGIDWMASTTSRDVARVAQDRRRTPKTS
jgi:transposase